MFNLESTRITLRNNGCRLFDFVNETRLRVFEVGATLKEWEQEEDYIAAEYIMASINGDHPPALINEKYPIYYYFHQNRRKFNAQEMLERYYRPIFDARMKEIRQAGIYPSSPVTKMSGVRKILSRVAKEHGYKAKKIDDLGTLYAFDLSECSDVLVGCDSGSRLFGGNADKLEEFILYRDTKENIFFNFFATSFWPAIKVYTDFKFKIFPGLNFDDELDIAMLVAGAIEQSSAVVCVAGKTLGSTLHEALDAL